MLTDVLFPAELQLRVDGVEMEKNTVNIMVASTNGRSACPHCQTISERIHSSYSRHPADLPLADYTVRLGMAVHRFFCDNGACEAKTFTERIPAFIQHYARRTDRLAIRQQSVAIEAGGAIGQRVLTILDMPVNSDTLIRFIRNAPEPDVATPRVVGVDEWSKRKGQSYGTILVDLEAHQPVDLLPDKSAESFAKWLREHPGVEVISRDRGVEYIKGATEGAPGAIQVADRWHLLTNLRDALKRLLESNRACLKAAAEKATDEKATDESQTDESRELKQAQVSDTDIESHSTSAENLVDKHTQKKQLETTQQLTRAEQEKQARHAIRQERYEAVCQLHQQGVSIRGIARRLRRSRHTVRKYIEAETCPMYPEDVKRGSKLAPYASYIQQRWDAGCHNASQIWRELRDLGFDGSRGLVACWVSSQRAKDPSSFTAPPSPDSESTPNPEAVPWSPSRASWLLVSEEDELKEEDKQALERMKQADEKVAEAYDLGQRFAKMVRERQHESLLPWLEDVARSKIDALTGFANGIKQDLAAVTNALSLPWSNGQTEGQVNRLKLIKRQMYGRANFDLLRRRVLARPIRC
ncbi:ISL3 family transposase [Candidatus Poribacteria bacterium]